MQLTGSCYAFYALRKEQRVIPAKEKPPDCLVVAFFYYLSDFYILSFFLIFIKIFYEKNSKNVLTLTRNRVIINT